MVVECHNNFNIKNMTTFKVGGIVDCVYFPKNIDEFLTIPQPYKVFGGLSNTIISTDGYSGTLVLTCKMDKIEFNGPNLIVGCGVRGPKLAQEACKRGLSGLEFMIGFPGSIGGEVFMNASANGQAISDCIKSVTLFSPQKGVFKYTKEQMEFEYRKSVCQREKFIVLEAEFELANKNIQDIETQMTKNLEFRKNHQPSLKLPNCGSVFRNPIGDSAGRLLDDVGAKEFAVGGCKVWEHHANFIVNTNDATSLDILNLMCLMKNKVKEKHDIDLFPEVFYLGNKNKDEEELCKILYQK